eukprot:15399017-Heterocapsa_arctica.AAC.1
MIAVPARRLSASPAASSRSSLPAGPRSRPGPKSRKPLPMIAVPARRPSASPAASFAISAAWSEVAPRAE